MCTCRFLILLIIPQDDLFSFFPQLMDSASLGGPDYNPFLCGEESFGTGSNHVREKDGLWAVLAWLSILAKANEGNTGPLVSVEAIVRRHWATYGRNFYCRYDYEGVESAGAEAMMNHLRARIASFSAGKNGGSAAAGSSASPSYTESLSGGFALAEADEFRYVDPVDGSVSDKQGLRFIMSDGSRVVYRLSGTGSVGATVRVYIEKFEGDVKKQDIATAEALKDLVKIAVDELGEIARFTGRSEPTVIT
jgi:phosphoglucomutase